MTTEVIGDRYTILRKLAVGGMAEVFLAKMGGLEGFERLCVVKRILPHYAQNPDYVRMFLDEARVAADLRHPNVLGMSDVGQDQGSYFVAMELLHGKDLGHVYGRCREKGERLPLEVSLHMVADAAAGLHYAHQKTDLKGTPLGIVHRDVSPQNLFVSFDGHTRVLDFGIARSANRDTRTEAGVVKGKFTYLSPEQLESLDLDGRSDQFALGVVLYELTTLTRLFSRPSDAEVLRAVMECRIPKPSAAVPDYPPGLEAIVLRALAKNREDRFPDCDALRAALEAFLAKAGLAHSASRVAQAMRELFPDDARAEPRAVAEKLADENAAREKTPTPRTRADGRTRTASRKAVTRDTKPARPLMKEAQGFLQMVQDFLCARPEKRKTNLVPPQGPFVGRAADLAALEGFFAQGARLVTVVGFGGMGKTRLSQEYALGALPQYKERGGAWFCDLADCRSADDVVKAVARALEVETPSGGSDEDTVTHAARTLKSLGPALVVLDNFEQLVDHAKATVGRWLELAPEIRFLVTTREALRLPGERVHALAPLAVGEDGQGEGVQLFLERMKLVGAKPATGAELRDVAALVKRLDGHPLAIELAAARASTLRPGEILERLGERFELLGGREQTGRHATLWNAIDWSYQLLDLAEQRAFRTLSVFRGGFTLEAAEGVLGPSLGADRVAPLIEALHRKSLLRPYVAQEDLTELRLTMLESIQLFAAEMLDGAGETTEARGAHADWFLARGEDWAEDVHAHEAAERMATLRVERENLLEVYERALATLPPTDRSARRALRALNALDPLLVRQGPFSSHLALLDSALDVARQAKVEPAYIARALAQKGSALKNRGRLAEGVEALQQALAEVGRATDLPLSGRIHCELGVARFVQGDLDGAAGDLEQSLAIARKVGDATYESRALSFLAILKIALGENAQALAFCDEALPLTRAHGDRVSEARVLGTIGSLYLEEERPELAQAFYSEAVERCRAVGEQRLRGYFQGKLASVTGSLGLHDRAARQLDEAINLVAEVGDLRHEGLFLAYRSSVNARAGRLEAAGVDLGAAEARLRSVKDPLLLTALALRKMLVDVYARAAGRAEVRSLLDDVRTPRAGRRARVHQSDEVRVAARELERADRALANA